MIDLNAISERALGKTVEGLWGQEVILTGPTGVRQYPRAQVVREAESVSEDSRGIAQGGRHSLIVVKSSVALRTSSLNPVPTSEEKWMCAIPTGPEEDAPMQTMYVESVPQGSKTLGLTILKLTSAKAIP